MTYSPFRAIEPGHAQDGQAGLARMAGTRNVTRSTTQPERAGEEALVEVWVAFVDAYRIHHLTRHPAPAGSALVELAACFARGTLIATPDGPVAVQDLAPGDPVTLASGETDVLRWVATCTPGEGAFYRIHAEALGIDLPRQDTVVGPRCRISPPRGSADPLAAVPVSRLVDGNSVVTLRPGPDLEFFALGSEGRLDLMANGMVCPTLPLGLEQLAMITEDARRMLGNEPIAV